MRAIELKTEVPGPRSRALMARREAAIPVGIGHSTPVFVERAEGALLHDVDGNTFIDFAGGIGTLNVGHCPSRGRRGGARAARKIHPQLLRRGPLRELRRARRAPQPLDPGGLRQEDAVRQQRCRGGRERGQDRPPGDRPRGGAGLRARLPRPHSARHVDDQQGQAVQARLRSVRPRDLPPALPLSLPPARRSRGRRSDLPARARGVLRHPRRRREGRLRGDGAGARARAASSSRRRPIVKVLLELCRKHGILFVADEIQTGFGRTGRMWAMEHYGSSPTSRRSPSRSPAACRSRR